MATYDVVPSSISVVYSEMNDSPQESWDETGPKMVRKLKCAWSDRWLFAKQLLGYNWAAGLNIIYNLPHAYPGVSNVFAVAVTSIVPFGAIKDGFSSKIAEYTEAVLTVQYEPFPIGNVLGVQTLVSESLEPIVEFLTMPNRKLFWDAGKTQKLETDEAPGVMIRMLNWNYTIHHMPYIPDEVLTLPGYVNDSAITSPTLGKTFAAETLLFNPPFTTRQITTEGAQDWEVTYSFSYRQQGWNKLPKAGESVTEFKIIFDNSGSEFKIYPTADLSAVLLL